MQGRSYRVCCICSSIPCVSGVKWSTYTYLSKKIPHLRDQGISEARAGRQAGRLASASKRPSGPRGHGPCGQLRQIRRWTVDGSRQRRSERLDFDRLESSRVRRAAPCRRALRQSPRLTPTPILRPSVASHQPPVLVSSRPIESKGTGTQTDRREASASELSSRSGDIFCSLFFFKKNHVYFNC